MSDLQKELMDATESLEALRDHQDNYHLSASQEAMTYLQHRQMAELEEGLGMEKFGFQEFKDAVAAAGRFAVSIGKGFMKFLDTIHRTIDRTHLVRLRQLREKLESIPSEEAKISKGKMEREELAKNLAMGGTVHSNYHGITQGLLDFSRRVGSSVLPDLVSMNNAIGNKLDGKRWQGTDLFLNQVDELVDVIGDYKLPLQRYSVQDYQRMYPGDRSIFKNVKPSHPRKHPTSNSGAIRKIIEAVTVTNIGIAGRSDVAHGKANAIIPILTVEEALRMLDQAELLLKEALRIKEMSKGFGKSQIPSTMGLLLSGFVSGVKKQIDDIWTMQDDGFDVIEGVHQGGPVIRHKPGQRNMLGGLAKSGFPLDPTLEAKKDQSDDADRVVQASWVVRYLRMSLIDHQKTSQALIMLLVGVARSYLRYVEESYDYYT